MSIVLKIFRICIAMFGSHISWTPCTGFTFFSPVDFEQVEISLHWSFQCKDRWSTTNDCLVLRLQHTRALSVNVATCKIAFKILKFPLQHFCFFSIFFFLFFYFFFFLRAVSNYHTKIFKWLLNNSQFTVYICVCVCVMCFYMFCFSCVSVLLPNCEILA